MTRQAASNVCQVSLFLSSRDRASMFSSIDILHVDNPQQSGARPLKFNRSESEVRIIVARFINVHLLLRYLSLHSHRQSSVASIVIRLLFALSRNFPHRTAFRRSLRDPKVIGDDDDVAPAIIYCVARQLRFFLHFPTLSRTSLRLPPFPLSSTRDRRVFRVQKVRERSDGRRLRRV